ncbi:hypothetical protein SDJN02_25687, partial [Cucurbita argyrosperma subsp. argyrosperma]
MIGTSNLISSDSLVQDIMVAIYCVITDVPTENDRRVFDISFENEYQRTKKNKILGMDHNV